LAAQNVGLVPIREMGMREGWWIFAADTVPFFTFQGATVRTIEVRPASDSSSAGTVGLSLRYKLFTIINLPENSLLISEENYKRKYIDNVVAPCYLILGAMKKPGFDLGIIKGLIKDGSWSATVAAMDAAVELGFDEEDMRDCIVNHLEETHFYKTMESEKKPGLMQDVYRITYQGERLYVKLQVVINAVVVSFKEQD
jgi:motility quorum-sensing regulator / GCU-specific mRNA interferase toxin